MDTGVSDAIEQLRGKLLDLTARNHLINYRHPKASSLRIVDERPAHIFKRLVQDTGSEEKPISLKLQPVSDPSADQARRYWDKAHPGVPWRDQRPDATTFAESLGIDVRFDITPDQGDVEKSPHHVDDRLQVLLYADELDARARRMRNSARTMIEETGSNSLFLVLGYLQWSESESSSSTYLALLILVPIQLHEAQGDAAGANTASSIPARICSRTCRYKKSSTTISAFACPSLPATQIPKTTTVRCGRDFCRSSLGGPSGASSTSASSTMEKFCFGGNLDPKNWPAEGGPHQSPLVRAILTGMIEPDENGEASPNNPRPDPLDLPLVELADASQAETLARALREKTLVVEGPPGTGKSQTITNLIAAGLYEAQTVLFVAEKLAALEVVRRKLMQSSLADFTLELHSHKTQKALVFRDLERRLVLQPESVRGDDAELLYRRAAAELDQAAAELGHPANELGDTRSDVFRDAGVANRWLQAFCPRLLEAEDAELPTDPSRRHQLANALQDLSENLVSMQGEGHSPADHPWRIVDPERAAPINAVARLQRLKALAEALRDLSSQAAALDFELDEGDRSSGALVEAGLDAAELERLIGVWNALSEIVARADQAWRRAKPALERIAQAISRAGVESATDLDILAAVLNLAESAPVDFDPAWPERLLSRDAGEKVEALRAELSDLRQRREELRRIFRDASLETATATEARESADVLERMGFFAFLSRAGRAARRYFAERAAPGVRLNRAARVKALRRLSEFAELRSRLLATEVYTQCFGSLFRGDRTDIDAIMRMRNWLLTAREKLSEPAADGVPLWRKLARSDPSVLTDLIDLGRDNVRDGLAEAIRAAQIVREIDPEHTIPLSADTPFADALRAVWKPGSASIRTRRVNTFLQENPDPRMWRDAAAALGRIAASAERLTAARTDAEGLLTPEARATVESTDPDSSAALLERACAHPAAFDSWRRYASARARAVELGGGFLVRALEAGEIPPEHVSNALTSVSALADGNAILAERPAILDYGANWIARRRADFVAADDERRRRTRRAVRERLLKHSVPEGSKGAKAGDFTELALIKREVEKKSRHVAIRELVRRAPKALQALKPCFMMGPISVAQYLPPGGIEFDLLVMDEASQITPEDALSALARCKRAVIIGDTKQLPPTSFFNRAMADSDDGVIAAESQSLLELAQAWPRAYLNWHYRSAHESLIAFSNRHFYGERLVVFPTPGIAADDLGIRLQRVSGAFDHGRNRIEATEIARAAVHHLATRPAESLGVVAMNREQADLIADLIVKFADESGFALTEYENRAEPYFVKNLENVQGDERDVMMLSMTYGPAEPGGVVLQNFGPINQDGGERRLNVLFTRARRRMVVFSSMTDGDIRPTPTSKAGVHALKGFLRYAETGRMEGASFETGRPPDSPFEIEVESALRGRGLDVVAQVGVAGFFIDLAVRDPERPGCFILGIECDGASYHSCRFVRDRDRLRQARLEELGWRIERIWSTDWFADSRREIERMLAAIESILQARSEIPPAETSLAEQSSQVEAQTPAGETEGPASDFAGERMHLISPQEARERLIELRETEMARSFPNVSESANLLRPEVLDILLRARPTELESFHRAVPLRLREETDREQFRCYAQEVLDILAAIAPRAAPELRLAATSAPTSSRKAMRAPPP